MDHGDGIGDGTIGSRPISLDELYDEVGLEPPVFDRSEVEQRSGVDRARALRWWRALGFPEVPEGVAAFGKSDVAVVRRLGLLIDEGVVDEAGIMRLARLLGSSFSRIAEAQVDIVEAAVDGDLGALAEAGTDPQTRARMAAIELSMLYVWRRHLLAALGHRIEARDAGTDRAVGFADITAFTKLTKRLGPAELAGVVDRFEAMAFDVVSSHRGRVVKLIGDEVMFVCDALADAANIGLDLIEQQGGGDRPIQLHCGIACGPTVEVGGDVFGSAVNLASRLTTIARPGTVVAPRDQAKALVGVPGLAVHPSRQSYDLKGIGSTRLAAVRRVAIVERAPEPQDVADD